MRDLSIVLLIVDLSRTKMQIDRMREEDVVRSCERRTCGGQDCLLRKGDTKDQSCLKNER